MTVSCLPNNPSFSFISSHSPCNIVMLLEMFHFFVYFIYFLWFCVITRYPASFISCQHLFFIFLEGKCEIWALYSYQYMLFEQWFIFCAHCIELLVVTSALGFTLFFVIIASEEKKKVSFLLQFFFIIFFLSSDKLFLLVISFCIFMIKENWMEEEGFPINHYLYNYTSS